MSRYCVCGHAEASHRGGKKCKACDCAAFQQKPSRQERRRCVLQAGKEQEAQAKRILSAASIAALHGVASDQYQKAIQRMTQKDRDHILRRVSGK